MTGIQELLQQWLAEIGRLFEQPIPSPTPTPILRPVMPPRLEEVLRPGLIEELQEEMESFSLKAKEEAIKVAPGLEGIGLVAQQLKEVTDQLKLLTTAFQRTIAGLPRGLDWQTDILPTDKPLTLPAGEGKKLFPTKGVGDIHFVMARFNQKTIEGSLRVDSQEIKFDLPEFTTSELDTPLSTPAWWLLYYEDSTPQYVLVLTPTTPIRFYQNYELFFSNTGTEDALIQYAQINRAIASFTPV